MLHGSNQFTLNIETKLVTCTDNISKLFCGQHSKLPVLQDKSQLCIISSIHFSSYIVFYSVLDCDVLDTIENGYIEYSDGTVYQSVATYNCHNGHNLAMTGNEMRTCGSDGNWNGTAPTCDSEY